jgi:uncharacterized membrane protein YphA (DoxX/SURF4 family)
MTRIPTVLRILLGFGFTLFGLNYFLEFLPPQDPPPPEAMPFLGAFVGAKFLTLVKAIEVGAGLLLLSNRFVPLALALLAPILVGMVYFHAMLAPAGIGIALVFLVLELGLAWAYRDAFAPMLRARVAPTTARSELRAVEPITRAA